MTDTKAASSETKVTLFQDQQLRRVYHNDEWWFSIIDVITILASND